MYEKNVCALLAMALVPFCALAVDGVVLINQSTVMAAGGFPYSINTAGSYKLSGNLLVPNGVQGILISASNVTLDLNGFSITSVDNTGETFMVITPVAQKGVTVRNGTISCTNCHLIETLAASGTVLEDLTLLSELPKTVFLGSSVIVRRVSFPGPGNRISVTCPALVVDSLASVFLRNQAVSTACAFGSVSGAVQ